MKRVQPNILFFFTDQQRFDTVGAHGNATIRTPVLDRLARDGTSFTRGYTPSPVCVAARGALVTGLPPHMNGCVDNAPMPRDHPSFMEKLRERGYETHGVGKMHFLPDHRKMWGFDSRDVSEEIKEEGNDYVAFLRENGYGHVHEPNGVRSEFYYIPQPSQLPAHLHESHWVGDRSIDFLKGRDRARPFFLWTSFIKPHPPFEAPTPWNKTYRCSGMARPHRPENSADFLTFWNRVQNRYKYKDAGTDDLLLRTMRATYYAAISFIDYNIGRVLEALGDDLDSTLIVFSSDHGELLGDYSSFGKRSMLEASVRVPFIARWPGNVPSGKSCGTPVSLLDLWPTFLSAAGDESRPPYPDSCDLVKLSREMPQTRYVISQYQECGYGLYMITDGTKKYVYSAPDQREWLFDLSGPGAERLEVSGVEGTAVDSRHPLKRELILRLERDGYSKAVEEGRWTKYPLARFPADCDAGLLRQDPPSATRSAGLLGPYAPPPEAPSEGLRAFLR